MSEVPIGWTATTLGELISGFETGRNLKASSTSASAGEIGVLKISAVTWGRFQPYENKALLRGDAPFAHELVRSGDLLISRANTTELVGAPVLVDRDYPHLMLPDKILRLVYDERAVDRRFLLYALRSQSARAYMEENATGTSDSMRNLSQPKLRQVPIALAPLPEQKRIADKLDALLARVYACRVRLDRIPAILKRFRQSVLAAATSGELTREWQEAQGVSSEWTRLSVADVAAQVFDGPFGSHLKSSDYVDSGIRVVRLENIAPLRFIENKRTYISQAKYEGLAKHTLLAEDVLFSSFVDEEVRVCLVPEEISGRAINKADCFCIRVDAAKCRPMFLALQLACRTTFEGLEDMVHGATRPRINLGQLRAIQLKLPSLEAQEEVVRRSTALLELADNLERRLGVVLSHIERTPASALTKAFRGELAPQDPNDEPASELLARIGSRNASPDTKGRPKRSGALGPSTKTKAQTDMLTRKDVTTTHLTSILKERGALTAEALWTASQLDIDGFYDQLKDEEARGLLRENRGDSPTAPRLLEAAA